MCVDDGGVGSLVGKKQVFKGKNRVQQTEMVRKKSSFSKRSAKTLTSKDIDELEAKFGGKEKTQKQRQCVQTGQT